MENELIKAIKNIKLEHLEAADKEELLRIFNVVKSPNLRNHIAMLFSDLKYQEAVPALIAKITDHELFNNTGTLIFALYELEVKEYFTTMIKVVCEQEFEARLMALDIIEKYAQSISPEVKEESLIILITHRTEKEKNYIKADYPNSTLNFIDQTIKLLESV
ncbi:hypothetical protein [Pedobacter sp. UBA5917]|uniref:hypothetical protein n=1 Tax=Pedobacter sp. UBA5917 TaxID=1947061 RepID=UPI0025ED40EB|nr:hypothetical protein [Pedobacter sp. UBA5917]